MDGIVQDVHVQAMQQLYVAMAYVAVTKHVKHVRLTVAYAVNVKRDLCLTALILIAVQNHGSVMDS